MLQIINGRLVPDDYDDLLSYYTKRGYRVIAIAGKSVEGLTWLKAQRLKRFVAKFKVSMLILTFSESVNKRNQAFVFWDSSSLRTS